jgi:hypothetical protein
LLPARLPHTKILHCTSPIDLPSMTSALISGGIVICCVLPFLPFIYLEQFFEERISKEGHRARRPKNIKPAAVKTNSRRPLTPPLSKQYLIRFKKKLRSSTQSGSPLFFKLPAELRAVIWQYCVQGRVHVYWFKGHLLGQSCKNSTLQADDRSACYASHVLSKPIRSGGKINGRLALLMTSRRM